MAYKFSMEKILDWREDLEKASMERFALTQNELNQEKLKLSNLYKEYESLKERFVKYKSANEIKQYQLYKSDLEKKIELQIQVVEEKTNELEERRLELVDAQKDRKIMEKLKEKDYENYKEKENLEEQKFLDEISVVKYKKAVN
ncbi:MAG: flagellar export protein FliJ [Tissierellia bacterium]|jgi:flagellar FliJ protein|nr:flagellar export protein FliJ [Tissierellia bacterium]